eukprot:gene12581-16872_t
MPVDPKKKQWGDEDDEDDNENAVDNSGIKERVKISVNAKGQKVKTTTKVKVVEFKSKVPLRVFERKNLPRFGDAKAGEENVTLRSPDFVSMEHPDDQAIEDADDPTISKTLANFITKQAERNMARDNDLENFFEDNIGRNDEGVKSDRYVAPGSRAAAASGGAGGGETRDGADNTIRVSNLSKATTEDDLRDLFEPFGKIHRISLPKVERMEGTTIIKEPRGFAYIAYYNREDAEKAMSRLQNFGYDHLIIKLEWAKPNQGNTGFSEGMNSKFMSGYGQKLAQDTTEKVYNLTSSNNR